MAILGLMSSESFASQRFTSIRRQVFYFYPNGAAPLTGLMSLMKDESVSDPEFSTYEKRLSEQRSTTVTQGGGLGPFKTSADGALADPFTWTADTTYVIYVADNTIYRVGHQVKVGAVTVGNAGSNDLIGIVTENPATTGVGKIKVRALHTLAGVDNGAGSENTAKEVWVVGSAFMQGSTDTTSEIYNLPVNVGNYCQIFRTPFSMTGTALKTSAKFDETGPYKDKAKEHSVMHMIEMEKSFIFGVQRKYNDPTSGLPTYTMGGILSYLKLWEAGATYGNSAATLDADDNKRIITNAAGTINEVTYDKYLERVFRVTNNKANEKLVLCGSGALATINQLYRSKSTLTVRQGDQTTYGMTVVQHDTPFGTIYYKTHPLFSQNPTLRYNMLFCDVPNMMYRYVEGRDTELLKNRQPNDADYRKDEWLSECGLELRFPESFMYLQNLQQYIP